MYFGAHSYLWVNQWADEHINLFEHIASLGVEAFELSLGDDIHFDYALTRKAAEAFNIKLIVGPGGHWPKQCDISLPSVEDRQRGVQWHQKNIRTCAELGVIAYTGAIYGRPGRVAHHLPSREEYLRIAESLHLLAEFAENLGVKLILEPMSHFRTHLVNRPGQALELIRLADHQNLHLLLDTYHLVTEIRDFRSEIINSASHLWGFHACANDRGVPGEDDLIPWGEVADALKQINFNGCIELESYNSSPTGQAAQRGLNNNPCPDGDDFVKQGFKFLHSLFE